MSQQPHKPVDTNVLDGIRSYAPDKVKTLVQYALDDIKTQYEHIGNDEVRQNRQKLELHVHSIKSIAAQFGANTLAGMCEDIERSIQHDQTEDLDQDIKSLSQECEAVIVFFEDYVSG